MGSPEIVGCVVGYKESGSPGIMGRGRLLDYNVDDPLLRIRDDREADDTMIRLPNVILSSQGI